MNFEKDYLEDDQSQEPKEDIYLNGFVIEFNEEVFYCNDHHVTHEEMIDTIDFIGNINEAIRNQYEKPIHPLYIKIFNMKASINVIEEMFRKFEPNI